MNRFWEGICDYIELEGFTLKNILLRRLFIAERKVWRMYKKISNSKEDKNQTSYNSTRWQTLEFDFDSIDFYKKKFRQESLSNEEFLKSPTLHNKIKAAIVVVNQSLNEWEKVRKFELITNKISIENGEITPSMKLKRNVLEAKYKKVIDKFYS